MAINIGDGFQKLLLDPPWAYDNPQDFDPARGGTPYKQMSMEDLCALRPLIDQVSARDAMMFLWATFPKLPQALQLMEALGYSYSTVAFTWIKLNSNGKVIVPSQNMVMVGTNSGFSLTPKDIVLKGGVRSGQGYYTNANAEICLVGKRGKAASLRVNKSVKQVVFAPDWYEGEHWAEYAQQYPDTDVVVAPMLGHSAKPEEVRERIDVLTGDIPGLELFARPPARTPGWLKLGWEIDGADITDVLQQLVDGEYRRPKAA